MLALRPATMEDREDLRRLIERSARELSADDYRPEQVEGALQGAFGVDSQLIQDCIEFGCLRKAFKVTLLASFGCKLFDILPEDTLHPLALKKHGMRTLICL